MATLNLIPPPNFLTDRSSTPFKKIKLALAPANAEHIAPHCDLLVRLLDDALNQYEVRWRIAET